MPDKAIGKAHKDGVSGIHASAGQPQKQAGAPWCAVQEPACGYIRVEPYTTLWHCQHRGFRNNPMGGAGHDADTATHNNPVAPTYNRLGIGVDHIVQLILFRKEGLSRAGTSATLGLGHASVERHNVTASTKRLVAFSFNPDSANAIVLSPDFELRRQHPDHLKRQCVQRFWRIQPGNSNYCAVGGLPLFKDNRLVTFYRLLMTHNNSLNPMPQGLKGF